MVPGAPNAAPPPGRAQNAQPTVTPAFRRAPTVTTPLPVVPPPAAALTPIAPGAAPQGPRRMDDFRSQRREVQECGRTIITEPGRLIIRDPGGQEFVRHDEMDRFRYGARDIRTEVVGGENRTIVIRPDGSQIITVVGTDGQLMRRIRRDRDGREIVIIDNYHDPRAVGGFFVDLPAPVVRIPYDHYVVDYADAPPDLVYDTLEAPPVDRIDRRYSLDEIRYSPNVRMLMPSIDVNSINFDSGSWEITPDQASKLQVIADGLNRAIQRNPREVFLIEGHTDATGNDTDNLSLSDRRAESAAELLTQQFGVPAENLTSQGYGSQYLKEQTDGPSRINRRVTVRRITPLLNGSTASLPPPPPGIAPPR
jgi:OOP family OmpA-OmpF porin